MSAFLSKRKAVVIALGLAILTIAVFMQVTGHSFLNYDDGTYVAENPHVLGGLNAQGIAWAFSTFRAGNWHPLTWLSLMLDAQVFGPEPFGFHLMNLILHLINVLLLFWLLSRMTGHVWRSAFVAALFAVHPLHVESVAWVAERKDVLSTLFWLLTMLAYLRYVRRPSAGRYLAVFGLFALGLMAKPMLVTLPLVLLLMDYWPLGRFAESKKDTFPARRLIYEKAPLLILALASSVITYIAQHSQDAVATLDRIPAPLRAANALMSYAQYIGKTIVPTGLSIFYPYQSSLPAWEIIASAVMMAVITILVLCAARSRPYIAVGWLWYVITLAPVIGLVQVGAQAMADRYTYVPLIGLFIMVAWGVPGREPNAQRSKPLVVACAVIVAVFAVCSYRQVGYWQDSKTLFGHAVDVTSGNYLAHNNLGVALYQEGNMEEAAKQFAESVKIKPGHAPSQASLGTALMQLGRSDEAIEHLSTAVRLDNKLADAHNSLAMLLEQQGRLADAVAHYEQARRIDPENPDAHYNLASALAKIGRLGDSAAEYSEALRLRPDDAEARNNLGIVYIRMGRRDQAVREFNAALEIDPSYASAQESLAKALGMEQKYGQK